MIVNPEFEVSERQQEEDIDGGQISQHKTLEAGGTGVAED